MQRLAQVTQHARKWAGRRGAARPLAVGRSQTAKMTLPADPALTRTEDAQLLARYVARDRAAAQTLTDRHLPVVYRHALRLVGTPAEAEDIAQEVMLRLWQAAPDWRADQASLATWLYRVTANLCIDRLRRRKVARPGPSLSAGDLTERLRDPAPSAGARLQTQSRLDALQAALMTLPERQRQAVVLRHIEGLSNPQIAQIMQQSLRATESLIARGKDGLARALADKKTALGYQDDDDQEL